MAGPPANPALTCRPSPDRSRPQPAAVTAPPDLPPGAVAPAAAAATFPAKAAAAAAAAAAADLARVQAKVDAARALLVRLLQDVVVAESRQARDQAVQMLEVNEALVLAALRSQSNADAVATALADTARALAEAARAAELDVLTQLPNRALMRDRFSHAIAQAKRHGNRLAVLFVDLDNFKHINDAHGHATGDEALQRVAACLLAAVREADTVSRYGGDEFVILLTDLAQPADAVRVADKLLAALAEPCLVQGALLHLSASIGISLYPDDGIDAPQLISRADAAMYQRKRQAPGGLARHGQPAALLPAAPLAAQAVRAAGAAGRGGKPPPASSVPVSPTRASPSPAPPAATPPVRVLAAQVRRHAELREANEHLVLAALSAQALQAAAEQAQRQQTAFLAVVMDELRNPHAPIRIAAAMLGRAASDEPLLPRVQALVDQQAAKVLHLLAGRAGQAGTPVPDGTLLLARSALDMASLIDNALRAWRPVMASRQQTLEAHLPAGALPLHGDAARLAQLLNNLLDNASKYTPEGGRVRLRVSLTGESLLISVTDNGIGISALALPGVFEPFVQDAPAIGLNGVGLGIGLTVVRTIVDAHGGSVTAHSAGSGQGSQFSVTLPLAR